jgi:hypothetical protein
MIKYFLLLISAILILSSCSTAKKSHEVQAVRAPMAGYLKMTCQELVSEQRILLSEVEASGIAVDKAEASDKTTELVTWILFAPAAFFLEGNEAEVAKYAAQKGQLDAINESLRVNKCGVSK